LKIIDFTVKEKKCFIEFVDRLISVKKISEKLFFLFWSVEQTTVAAFKMNLLFWMNGFGRKRILKQIEILTEIFCFEIVCNFDQKLMKISNLHLKKIF